MVCGLGLNTETQAVNALGAGYKHESKTASKSKQTRRDRRQKVGKRAADRNIDGAKHDMWFRFAPGTLMRQQMFSALYVKPLHLVEK